MHSLASDNYCLKLKQPLLAGAVSVRQVYQLGNWKAGKTPWRRVPTRYPVYQLGNWKAGKTRETLAFRDEKVYQLGNWKAGKTF